MSQLRTRAKEHFPSVLLTLLSIVQALALELLWSHISEAGQLLTPGWPAVMLWLQILATFLSLVLIWVVYANNVMRFTWTPVTSDSVYPFIIGVIEFTLIESLGFGEMHYWFALTALIFALMTWITHMNMRLARHDQDNEAFFASRQPATVRDFTPQIVVISFFLAAALLHYLIPGHIGIAGLTLLATIIILAAQFYSSARFWNQSMRE